ncbi:hypothetical protein AS850_01715 [Frondihabitans sp. 762G35]|nr:hypothetical protein [Frondihabitans sp. 762G35]ARC55794.1 hypothetical protein AS850_01715 [Frondihabitans sp. 762G35]
MEIILDNTTVEREVASPADVLFIPTYVPTIEETVKASGGHQQAMG